MTNEMKTNETKTRDAIILTADPIVVPIASMAIDWAGAREMARWVKDRRPECLPDGWDPDDVDNYNGGHDLYKPGEGEPFFDLFPHNGVRREPTKEEVKEHVFDGIFDKNHWRYSVEESDPENILSDNELLVELAGRKCYDSFGLKAGRKSNAEYIVHTQEMDPPHASITYHAKMTFFIAGVSRRVSHELIRNYVGSDREEEGSPSQESTRYVEHAGRYITHPRDLESSRALSEFELDMRSNYRSYLRYIEQETLRHKEEFGKLPTGMDRKRIFEAASARLSHACETSWIWTTNPMALQKLIKERAGEAADLEFQRLARRWARVCMEAWPNLFPQPHVRKAAIAAGWEP